MTVIKYIKHAALVGISGAFCLFQNTTFAMSSLNKADAFPVYKTEDPQTFLLTCQKLKLLEDPLPHNGCHFEFSISPFGQTADRGKTIGGKPLVNFSVPCPNTDPCLATIYTRELGDLTGYTSMLALFFGTVPTGKTLTPSLQEAKQQIFSGVTLDNFSPADLADPTKAIPDINDIYFKEDQVFGYYSFPLRYRKRGLRFDFEFQYCDFGLQLETGVVATRQNNEGPIDRTALYTGSTFPSEAPDNREISKDTTETFLMNKLYRIADEMGLGMCDFIKTSIEEIRLSVFWRHLYELNAGEEDSLWPYAFVTPYIKVTGSFSPGEERNTNTFFSVPFGNNKHNAVGFMAGIDFDFVECVEIGGLVGYTHFFERSFSNYRIPTSEWQSNMFPFTTDVTIQPGTNWHFAGKIAAYHFVDMLSMYFQYVIVEHKKDHIHLVNPADEGVFLPEVLACTTSFKTKIANIGFNYDISSNLALGFLWQAPLSQRNTYRSTTIMFSFTGTF